MVGRIERQERGKVMSKPKAIEDFIQEREEEIFYLLAPTPLSYAEISGILKKVKARIDAIPSITIGGKVIKAGDRRNL